MGWDWIVFAKRVMLSVVVAFLTGGDMGFALSWGLVDDGILAFIGGDLSTMENIALTILADEVEHVLSEAFEEVEETERQRRYEERQRERLHPHQIYIFGDVSVEDALLLGISGQVIAQSTLPATVMQYSRGLLDRLGAFVEA